MLTKALQVTVFVEDQDEAKRFYTEKLGFVVRTEMEFAPGWSYLTVAPQEDSETVLELARADTPEKKALIGRQTAGVALVMFASDDIERDYRSMKDRGVLFRNAPQAVPGGKGAPFEDLYGNLLDMYQQEAK